MVLKIELAENVSSLSPEDFTREVRLVAAAELFAQRRVSSGRAAELAGVGRIEFLASLPRLGVSACQLSAEDLDSEIDFINRHF